MKSRVMMGLVLMAGLAAGAAAQPVPSMFTYQGKLTDGGQPANGQYDLYFRLYPSDTSIFPLGDPVALENVQVVNGVFTAKLDFGQGQFTGDPRWIAISVRPGTQTGAYTVLSPRQELTPAPHAIVASTLDLPVRAGAASEPDLFGANSLLYLTQTGGAAAIRGETSGAGNAVEGIHTKTSGIVYALHGETHSVSGRGVFGHAIQTAGSQAFGVHGQTESSTSGASGMRAMANGGGTAMTYGILAQSNSTGGVGAHGQGKFGVYGLGTAGGSEAVGLLGITSQTDAVGVIGRANAGPACAGVVGQAPNGGWAGFFEGDVRVAGLLWANDKDFLIDNPANPANEFLVHACIESDERRNLYDGVVSLDGNGAAVVQLPEWFDKLNASFRYQLTCIGGQAPVYIAREVENNQFVIAGGMPGLKVSWQVTGVRIDAYAQSRPFQAVIEKEAEDRGKFVSPEAFGLPRSQTIGRFPNPSAPRNERPSVDPLEATAKQAAAEGSR